MKEYTISEKEAGQRLDKYLKRIMPAAGTSFLYKMLRKKNIKLNDEKADGSDILNAGDRINIYFSDETFDKMKGAAVFTVAESSGKRVISDYDPTAEYKRAYDTLKDISVIYENDDCVIFYKPAGVLSQKADRTDLSINEYLIGYLLYKGEITTEELNYFKPSVLNRLDRNTKGLIICGKTLVGSRELSRIIKDRSLKKYYKAVIKGNITEGQDISAYLVKDEEKNRVRIFTKRPEDKGALRIHTVIEPLSKNEEKDGLSSVRVELITGKSHQIRAVLAHIGHPILGDNKYGDRALNRKHGAKYQELTAYKLVFPENCAIKELSGKTIEI